MVAVTEINLYVFFFLLNSIIFYDIVQTGAQFTMATNDFLVENQVNSSLNY